MKKNSETKVVMAYNSFLRMGGQTTYVLPAASFQIAQGDGSDQRVGRKITNASMRIVVNYSHLGENAAFVNLWEDSWIRMLVLRSRAIKTAGVTSTGLQVDPVNLQVGNIFRQTASSNLPHADVETRSWTVLKDVKWRSWRNLDGVGDSVPTNQIRKFRIPLGKNLTFISGDLFGYFVQAETYVVFVAGSCGSINGVGTSTTPTDNVGTISVTGEIMFKDA